jgi:hypothetical protein
VKRVPARAPLASPRTLASKIPPSLSPLPLAVLVQSNQPTRVSGPLTFTVDSFERVMPNCRSSNSAGLWSTQMCDAMRDVEKPASRPAHPPRDALSQTAIQQEAVDYVNSLKPPTRTYPKLSENHERYVRYEDPAYKEAATASARRGPKLAGSTALGPLGPPPRPAAAAAAEQEPSPANYEAYAQSDYRYDPPVTLYSSRLPEPGAFGGMTAARTAGIPLGRSATLTNSMAAAYQRHDGADDQGAAGDVTVGGSAMRTALGPRPMRYLAPGAELALKSIFVKFLRRFEDAKVDVAAFLAAVARHAKTDPRVDLGATAGSTVRSGPGGSVVAGLVPAAHFRSLVHALHLRLLDADLEAVVASCDVDGSGRVSLGALYHYIDVAEGRATIE